MNHHNDEVAKIMGVDEETVKVLPRIKYEGNFMNPYGNALLDLFRLLDLTPQHTVLDIPCGQGGVAVYLAKKYGVTATGYDLLPGFINNANGYAAEHGVQSRCRFYAEDIRAAIDAGREYDLVLWSAPPHLWQDYRQTVGNLRKCVKPGGHIVIADAYVYTEAQKAVQPDYETLEETVRSVTAYGDTVIKLTDYRETLWAENYQADREAVKRAIDSCEDQAEKEVLEKYLEGIRKSEQSDMECLGLYTLMLQVERHGTTS